MFEDLCLLVGVSTLFVLLAMMSSHRPAAPSSTGVAVRKPAVTGHCACGNVEFELSSEPGVLECCDCRACQRATGALQVAYVATIPAALRVSRGSPATAPTAEEGFCAKHGRYSFCPDCGTTLFWTNNDSSVREVLVGCLDQPYHAPAIKD